METMHFRIAQLSFFYDKMFRKLGGPNEIYGAHVKLSCGMQGSLKLDPGANHLADIELLWIKALVGLNLAVSTKHLISLLSCPNTIYMQISVKI